jgi:hypothetical protein
VLLQYDSPYVKDDVELGKIPLPFAHFPLPIIRFMFNSDGEPREAVHYAGGPMVDIATNSNLNNTTSLRIGEIFAIMSELMVAHESDAVNDDTA